MKIYSATTATGETVEYRDRKRYWWLLSLLLPLQPLIGIGLHAATGNAWWIGLPLVLTYILAPLIDWLLGEDRNNPPEAVLMQLDRDPYYRWLTFIAVPLHYVNLIVCAWYAATADLSGLAFAGLAILAGLTAGLAINTGHELGHKNSKIEKWLAKIALALPGYGHFTIEHNRGHHKHVSTPRDSSSARMGESIYRFAQREIPGAVRDAWCIEKERLNSRGKSVWHPHNQILQSYLITAVLIVTLVVLFGWMMLPFMLVHNAMAYWQLTSANYVEHYGLLRECDAEGRYERCEPRHSWNSNHIYSNLMLFHLQRHSDHHSQPLRRYQALRHYDDLPQLPSGYFGVYLLAYVPALWFRVMDKRLLALPQVGGDIDKINICPRARAALFLEYGRDKMLEPSVSKLPA